MEIRAAEGEHVDAIVQIHLDAFRGFFLTSLGAKFLRTMYRGFLADPVAGTWVAFDGDRPVAFVVGVFAPRSFFRGLLLRSGVELAWAAIPALTRRPAVVCKRLVAGFMYRGDPLPAYENAALLSSLAVRPADQGRGAARQLIAAFCTHARSRGCDYVYLTTDRHGNDAANRAYVANGFTIAKEIRRSDGRSMNVYVRRLADCSPQPE